jgi:hypothetical protein
MEEPKFEKIVVAESTDSLVDSEPLNIRDFNLPKKQYADP